MTMWQAPWVLWLLTGIPLLGGFLIYMRGRTRRAAAAFAEGQLLARLAPDVSPGRRAARDMLRLGVLAACVFALAGPRWGFHWEQVRREGVDLVIGLDVSRSMLAVDVKPNRIERAKLAILDLLDLLEGDRVALVPFAGTAFLQCPLTLDYDAFAQSLAAADVGTIPRGGTALERAIDTGIGAFEGRQGQHGAMILITDGESHEGDAIAAAGRAAEQGIRIFTVGVGTADGELIPLAEDGGGQAFLKDRAGNVVKSRLDEETLRAIADKTGGTFVRAERGRIDLETLFKEELAAIDRRQLESAIERRYEARFQVPLAIALVLLGIESLVSDRRWALGWGRTMWRRSRSGAAAPARDATPTASVT